MSEVVLYRKYRPHKFSEVMGQDHIVTVLQNAIKQERVSHAYLFAGPRGTGKTSVARILSAGVGCSDNDVIEIDAASSRGIDEIRALREAVQVYPLESPYKVYIIDEVHMLTKEAFNALLKTLEEPPGHAIFILATTELEKVPETIISRCQNFSFRKLPESVIRESIENIAKKEGFKIDDESSGIISLLADGSFRDSQSILDQVLSTVSSGKDIKGEKVREFLGVPKKDLINDFVGALAESNTDKGMEAIAKAKNSSLDIKVFLKLILRDIRFILLLKTAPDMKEKIKDIVGEKEFKSLEKIKENKDLTEKNIADWLRALLEAYDEVGRSYLPELPLELALIKIIGE